MNDRAREALVAAALKGVRQIKGALREGDGRCALGVLCDASMSVHHDNYLTWDVLAWAELQVGESQKIAHANDVLGWDFLTIARKIGVNETEGAETSLK